MTPARGDGTSVHDLARMLPCDASMSAEICARICAAHRSVERGLVRELTDFLRGSPGACASVPLQAAWKAYFRSMQDNGFDADTPMYIASGLLTYLNTEGALPAAVTPFVSGAYI